LMIKNAKKMGKKAACNFWTLRFTVPNSPITYNLSNFITGCQSLGDKIIEVLLYKALAIGLSLGLRKKPTWLMRLLEWECWIVFRRTLFSKLALKCWSNFISLHIGLEKKNCDHKFDQNVALKYFE
jgi:hypothetical protein